jgi:hypothetical protein
MSALTDAAIKDGLLMADEKEFVLASLRVGSLRCKAWDAEITCVGVALRGNLIEPDQAIKWVNDMGLMFLIEPVPSSMKVKKLDAADPTMEMG